MLLVRYVSVTRDLSGLRNPAGWVKIEVMRGWYRQVVVVLVLCVGLFGVSGPVSATTPGDPSSASTNYSVIEGEIGGNGQFNSSSSNFNIGPSIDDGGASLGESAVGNSGSTNFQTNSGFNTTAQPGLTFVVNTPSVSLGTLSAAAATFGTATFDVTNYTTYGYAVTVIGNAPTYGSHPLTAMGTQSLNSAACSPTCASVAGSEQFGINLVHNTVAGNGVNPGPPTGGINSQGAASGGYAVSDSWRFFSGDTIASASKNSGDTHYTMTLIATSRPILPFIPHLRVITA